MARRPPSHALIERFALEYIKDLNATQAYLRIKPSAKTSTASVEGSRLLGNPKVGERIRDHRMEQADRLKVDADNVVRELAICGFSDVRDFVMKDGALDLSETAHPLASRAVASVKHKRTMYGEGEKARTEDTVEYRLWNKPESLRTLAQHLGIIDREGPSGGQTTVVVVWKDESR